MFQIILSCKAPYSSVCVFSKDISNCMVALALVSPAETCNCARGRARKTWRAFKTLDRRSYWLCRHSLRQPKQGCLRECNGSNAPVRCKAADNACSQKISRRTLGLCAASLALSVRPVPRRVLISCSAEDGHRSLSMQIAQPLRPAEAKHVGSYDLAATNQQVRRYASLLSSLHDLCCLW